MEEKHELQNVNPWREVFSGIAWGFFLCYINLNFLSLQYILPLIGTMKIAYGFYQLRRENQYFRVALVLSAAHCARFIINLCILASPLALNEIVINISGIIGAGLTIALFLTFRRGVFAVDAAYRSNKKRDPLLGLTVLTIAMLILIFTPYRYSTLISLVFIVVYIGFLVPVVRIGDELFVLRPDYKKPEELMDPRKKHKVWVVIAGYCAACILFVTVTCIFANHKVPSSVKCSERQETVIRNELCTLGFPETILNDLSDDNVRLLKDALRVSTYDEEITFKNSDVMLATTIVTELPGNQIYYLEYMEWKKGNAFWNDGFTIWGADVFSLVEGKMLWEKGSTSYEAKMNRLTCEDVMTNSMFFGQQQERRITGQVCFPFYAKNARAYVFYEATLPPDAICGNSCLNYNHKGQPIQIPFAQPEQLILDGAIDFNQHYIFYQLEGFQEFEF